MPEDSEQHTPSDNAEPRTQQSSEVDPEKIADVVLRLMIQEIRVERARCGRSLHARGH
jgi:hypothetical protein